MNRNYKGGAAVSRLTADLGGTDNDRVLSMSTMQGWDFTTGQVFAVSVDRGLAGEEKMLCVVGSRNADGSGTLSVLVDAGSGHVFRGWDDTVISRHPVGAKVEHVLTATDMRELWDAVHILDQRTQPTGTWRDLLSKTITPIP